jgi:hypothetical protein
MDLRPDSSDVQAARELASRAAAMVQRAPSFGQLDPDTRAALVADLGTIQRALGQADPYALTLDTPNDRLRPRPGQRLGPSAVPQAPAPPADGTAGPAPRAAATETIAARAGALSDEIDFPAFVASLVHGTFDAIVDATIRQMEAFADLVSSVAKDVDQFTRDNVTPNQVRDWLVQRHPGDLELDPASLRAGQPRLRPRIQGDGNGAAGEAGDDAPPAWLADYGVEEEPLSEELIEQRIVPAARQAVGEQRLQLLATMVLLGMSRINVRDGSISARVRFRAAARDIAAVDYAVSQDPGRATWGDRGGSAGATQTMVSTVGVNVQAESDLKAELFGQVQINFESETLPLDRFLDAAQLTLLQRNARWAAQPAAPAPQAAPLPASQATPLPAPQATPSPASQIPTSGGS